MPRGLSKIRQINEENAAKKRAYEEGGGGSRYLTLQDGESAIVRFLDQGEDVEFFWMHELPKQPGESFPKRTPCLDQEDQGIACPGCLRGAKRSSQICIPVIWYNAPKFQRDKDNKLVKGADNQPIVVGTEDTVAVWKRGPTDGGRLEYLNNDHGGLVPHKFKIMRQGSGKDDTKYMIDIHEKNVPPTAQEAELMKAKPKPRDAMGFLSYGDMERVYSGGQPTQQPASGTAAQPGNQFADAAASGAVNKGAFS
jgi:hypothetical protein